MSRIESSVVESGAHWPLALQAARIVAWEWDPARDVVVATENLGQMYGLASLTSSQQGFAVIHPQDLPGHRAAIDRALAGEDRYRSEFRIIRPDSGSTVWLEERAQVERDDDGEVARVIGIVMDITERKRAEQSMRFLGAASEVLASSLDYEVTLRNVARLAVPEIADWCAVHIVLEDGTVRQLVAEHVDPAKVALVEDLARTYPYDHEAVSGVPQVLRTGVSEFVPHLTEDSLRSMTDDQHLLAIIRDLQLRSSMVVPLTARGRTLGAITLVAAESGRYFDQGDLALAEELGIHAALAIDNARLYRETRRIEAERSAMLEQMADGVMLCDARGTITFMNPAAQRLYGSDFTGRSLASYPGEIALFNARGEPYDVASLPIRRALEEGQATMGEEAVIRRADGTEIIAQRSVTPITAADGTRLGAILTVRDVTLQRNIDRQQDEFLSSVAHDLKSPLSTARSQAQFLQRRLQRGSVDETAVLNGLERIIRTTGHMATLIDQVLDADRLRTGHGLDLNLVEGELESLLREVIDDMVAETRDHAIRLLAPEHPIRGRWDVERLRRVFTNLLANAVKYSPAETEIVVRAAQEGDVAVVDITDRGVGILPEDLGRIFQRFQRGQNVRQTTRGTGIGLSGAQQIVQHHGGTIEVVSQVNEGSTFIVRLPLIPG